MDFEAYLYDSGDEELYRTYGGPIEQRESSGARFLKVSQDELDDLARKSTTPQQISSKTIHQTKWAVNIFEGADILPFLSTPVLMHGGLLYITFCLSSVCDLTKIQTRH